MRDILVAALAGFVLLMSPFATAGPATGPDPPEHSPLGAVGTRTATRPSHSDRPQEIAACLWHSTHPQLAAPRRPHSAHSDDLFGVRGDPRAPGREAYRGAGDETLWIFDADFEDLSGDNAGWLSLDMSGTLGHTNYWHKDTIRLTEPYLGDSAWWCGTENDCWYQPRGYGNDWLCVLERGFPLSEWSAPGDTVRLEWDQRYAMERNYDYGHVDLSVDEGSTWETVASYSNTGFVGAGSPADWDHPTYGHPELSMNAFAGGDVRLRFRFESDGAYSSKDSDDNPQHSFLDGAWQLDNIQWTVNDEPVWIDDCEAPGDNGWIHEDIPTTGQTGITFERVYDPETFRPPTCDFPADLWWMAALDSLTGRMVDGQDSWLLSPPIEIAGAENLLGGWRAWADCPRPTDDVWGLWLAAGDDPECVWELGEFEYQYVTWYYGPWVYTWLDEWDEFAGNDWLMVLWKLWNDYPAEEPHMTGFMLDYMRVGVPIGSSPTEWHYDWWTRFHDTFDLAEASAETARVRIQDGDGVAEAYMLASNDGGATWASYELSREQPQSDYWLAPAPVDLIAPAAEIWLYFEATDNVGVTRTYPSNAPASYFEFSVLPILGSVEDPAVLLVDKHGRATPGEDRKSRHTSEYYYREMLDILGYECDVFDVWVPSGSIQSQGPDTSGTKYYDTQIWFFNEFDAYTLWARDQVNLITWLSEAAGGKERNLLLTGNDFGKDLMETGKETLDFYTVWLGSEYIRNSVQWPDTLVGLTDASGGHGFMAYDDHYCILRGGCPRLNYFDVVQPGPAVEGAEVVAEYERLSDHTFWPAGVAYTHPEIGYQTVNLGFGMEFMMDALLPSGYYATGIGDRVDLMKNIMEYFGKEPTGSPTEAPESSAFVTRLGRAYPNPFNPVVTIEYDVAADAHVTLRVYSINGRLVKTLVDWEVAGGGHTASWDGKTEQGHRPASGVYFVRMEAPNFEARRTIVLLK